MAEVDPSLASRAGKVFARLQNRMPDLDRLVPGPVFQLQGIVLGGEPVEVRRVARAMIGIARLRLKEKSASRKMGSE